MDYENFTRTKIKIGHEERKQFKTKPSVNTGKQHQGMNEHQEADKDITRSVIACWCCQKCCFCEDTRFTLKGKTKASSSTQRPHRCCFLPSNEVAQSQWRSSSTAEPGPGCSFCSIAPSSPIAGVMHCLQAVNKE